MYIAFKWLVGLSLAMWVAACSKDLILKISKNTEKGFIPRPFGLIFKNTTVPKQKIRENRVRFKHDSIAVLHCSMFLAGALAVTIFNRKSEIILFAKSRIHKINLAVFSNKIRVSLNKTAIGVGVTILKYLQILWSVGRILFTKINVFIASKPRKAELNTVNFILLKKLKELGEERKNLGQLLISAIHENKNIRMKYQLESMAKTRLMRHIEQSQSQMKENRSRYVSFQQLYLVTHQENLFLKTQVRKLTKDKEEVQKNLMELMNEIYKSKNTELKAYCSRFIVSSKDNLLNSDVKLEIQKFLQNNRRPRATRSRWEISEQPEILVNSTRSCPRCNDTRITEILYGDDCLVPVVSVAPKLKGLPGECVWTVKDKDGIIEKLYEYDYETDFDNGDTIRRIRQYSVYYDKDCLLDFSNSRTTVNDNQTSTSGMSREGYSLTNARFLTGSEAFQIFLQDSTEIVASPRGISPGPPFLCG